MTATTRFLSLLATFSILATLCLAQIPCDAAYGEFCPAESGWAVGDCIKKLPAGSISAECSSFIELQETCRSDINAHCGGKEYSGDLLVCLTEWTKPEFLTTSCREALPKKAEKKEKKLSKEERVKADRRKKIRNKAAKMARGGKDDL